MLSLGKMKLLVRVRPMGRRERGGPCEGRPREEEEGGEMEEEEQKLTLVAAATAIGVFFWANCSQFSFFK